MEAHLQAYSKRPTAFRKNVKSYLETVLIAGTTLTGVDKKNWTRRFKKQVIDIYLLAFFLHLQHYKANMSLDQQTTIVNLFKKHISNYQTAFKHFLDF